MPDKNSPLLHAKIQLSSIKFALFCTQEWTILVGCTCIIFTFNLKIQQENRLPAEMQAFF